MKEKNQAIKCWPFNLSMAIFDNEEAALSLYVPGLYDAIDTLKEREKNLIYLYYQQHCTYESAGQTIGVSRERVRQIISRAHRLLRHPKNLSLYKSVPSVRLNEANAELQETKQELDIVKQKLDEAQSELAALLEKTEVNNLRTFNKFSNMSIDLSAEIKTLESVLSVRAYNALVRKGIRTVGELTLMTVSDLGLIRNIGKKTVEEICACLECYGIVLPED